MLAVVNFDHVVLESEKKEPTFLIGKDRFMFLPLSIFSDIFAADCAKDCIEAWAKELAKSIVRTKIKNKEALLQYIKNTIKIIGLGDVEVSEKESDTFMIEYLSFNEIKKSLPREAPPSFCTCTIVKSLIFGILENSLKKR